MTHQSASCPFREPCCACTSGSCPDSRATSSSPARLAGTLSLKLAQSAHTLSLIKNEMLGSLTSVPTGCIIWTFRNIVQSACWNSCMLLNAPASILDFTTLRSVLNLWGGGRSVTMALNDYLSGLLGGGPTLTRISKTLSREESDSLH